MISSLNKFYGSVSKNEYWHDWGLKETNNAIMLSNFPEAVTNWIWEKAKSKGFSVNFSDPVRRSK